MSTIRVIKEEPELCIIDDPYVLELRPWKIRAENEEEVQDIQTLKATIPKEKEKRNAIADPSAKSHPKGPPRNTRSRPRRFINIICNCSVCDKMFDKLATYELHMSKEHNIKPYECATCGRKFSRKSYLVPHFRVHTGVRPYPCEHCTASFSRASDFKKHSRSHQGIKMFKCELCDLRFTRAYSLRYHLSAHTGEKPFVCDMCGTGFRKSTDCSHHKKTDCKNTFECVFCKEKFSSRKRTAYHISMSH